jgi:hypothetical protein
MIQQFVQEYLIESMVWFSDLLNKKKRLKALEMLEMMKKIFYSHVPAKKLEVLNKQCCGSGSGIGAFLILDPGFGIRNRLNKIGENARSLGLFLKWNSWS